MKKLLFLTVLIFSATHLFAQQSWQWGKRGGGSKNDNGPVSESAYDIATDPAGNVYILSNLLFDNNDVDIAGQSLSGRYTDIVVSSFSCTGTLRWTKVIGSQTTDRGIALRTDTLGGIYITGVINGYNSGSLTTISTDTSFNQSYKSMFVVKYDTAGNYKWFRHPQPDTAGNWTRSQPNSTLDMDVDKSGNSYSMCYLSRGTYGGAINAYSVTTPGVHMLSYDRNGNFLGGNAMDIDFPPYGGSVYKWWLTRTIAGQFIINGSPSNSGASLTFGTTTINRPGFVASFNSNGTLNWVKQSTLTYTNGGGTVFYKSAVDPQGNIYMSGHSIVGDGFGGTTFSNPGAPPGTTLPIVFKLDPSGNTLWSKYATGNIYANGLAGALNTNGEYVLGGSWTGTVNWPGGPTSAFSHPSGWLLGIFLTRFNAQTGAYIKMDTLYSPPGDNNITTAMAADKKGNVYLGGSFETEIKVAGTSMYAKPGGYFDFFLTKYGTANCNCVTPPVAALTQAGTSNASRTATFKYSGTTTSLDSLVWEWGNGQQQKVTSGYSNNITHQYGAAAGTYPVCVTAHTKDCSHTACQSVTFTPLGVEDIAAAGGVSLLLAPNPSTTETQISYQLSSNAGSLEVYDLAGRMLFRKALGQKTGTEKLSIAEYVPGLYLVVLREAGEVVLHRRLTVVR